MKCIYSNILYTEIQYPPVSATVTVPPGISHCCSIPQYQPLLQYPPSISHCCSIPQYQPLLQYPPVSATVAVSPSISHCYSTPRYQPLLQCPPISATVAVPPGISHCYSPHSISHCYSTCTPKVSATVTVPPSIRHLSHYPSFLCSKMVSCPLCPKTTAKKNHPLSKRHETTPTQAPQNTLGTSLRMIHQKMPPASTAKWSARGTSFSPPPGGSAACPVARDTVQRRGTILMGEMRRE